MASCAQTLVTFLAILSTTVYTASVKEGLKVKKLNPIVLGELSHSDSLFKHGELVEKVG